jgi:hypothetical protein
VARFAAFYLVTALWMWSVGVHSGPVGVVADGFARVFRGLRTLGVTPMARAFAAPVSPFRSVRIDLRG